MSEYWKSTPKYWCKHCGIYVRDTKLERSNHEATGKHQGALKRFLRDLHRGHDREEREKDRAKREIERLNGVVAASSSAPTAAAPRSSAPAAGASSSSSSSAAAPPRSATTEAQRQRQWEQLAELGIEVPTALRGDMAMAGEWTVTGSRVVVEEEEEEGGARVDAVATGVRKRVKREGEDEDEEAERAVRGLFKKPRRWGRDSRHAGDDDAELDALLSGTLAPVAKKEKAEDGAADGPVKKKGQDKEDGPPLKKEPAEDEDQGVPDSAKPLVGADEAVPATVKVEGEAGGGGVDAPAVVFKKRKPKNIRQK